MRRALGGRMDESRIEATERQERLSRVRFWFNLAGATCVLSILSALPLSMGNPKVLATSSYAALTSIGIAAWIILPLAVIGLLCFTVSWLISRAMTKYE